MRREQIVQASPQLIARPAAEAFQACVVVAEGAMEEEEDLHFTVASTGRGHDLGGSLNQPRHDVIVSSCGVLLFSLVQK